MSSFSKLLPLSLVASVCSSTPEHCFAMMDPDEGDLRSSSFLQNHRSLKDKRTKEEKRKPPQQNKPVSNPIPTAIAQPELLKIFAPGFASLYSLEDGPQELHVNLQLPGYEKTIKVAYKPLLNEANAMRSMITSSNTIIAVLEEVHPKKSTLGEKYKGYLAQYGLYLGDDKLKTFHLTISDPLTSEGEEDLTDLFNIAKSPEMSGDDEELLFSEEESPPPVKSSSRFDPPKIITEEYLREILSVLNIPEKWQGFRPQDKLKLVKVEKDPNGLKHNKSSAIVFKKAGNFDYETTYTTEDSSATILTTDTGLITKPVKVEANINSSAGLVTKPVDVEIDGQTLTFKYVDPVQTMMRIQAEIVREEGATFNGVIALLDDYNAQPIATQGARATSLLCSYTLYRKCDSDDFEPIKYLTGARKWSPAKIQLTINKTAQQ